MSITARIKEILLTPKRAWYTIREERTTVMELYTSYAVFLAAIPAIAGFIGLAIVGTNVLGITVRMSFFGTLAHAVVQYILSLVGLFIVGFIINALAPSFSSPPSMENAMKVAVYSSTAAWIAGVFLIFPALSPLAMLLSLYSLYLFFVGLPIVMDTPPEKKMGYAVVVIIVSIVVHLLVGVIANLFLPTRGAVTL